MPMMFWATVPLHAERSLAYTLARSAPRIRGRNKRLRFASFFAFFPFADWYPYSTAKSRFAQLHQEMAANKFTAWEPGSSGRAKKLQTWEWDTHRHIIEDLYIRQDKSLEDLITTMAGQYAFTAK
jgi:hypothetical protein